MIRGVLSGHRSNAQSRNGKLQIHRIRKGCAMISQMLSA